MTEQERKKPVDYNELFPGRFLKAGLFIGKTPTFTIADITTEDLPQEKGADRTRGIVAFRETKLQLVLNSTNGQCLKAMFGRAVKDWIGKRVTLCTEKDRDPNGKGMVDAVRVLGSPDLAVNLEIDIKMPRRKPKVRQLVKTDPAQRRAQPAHRQPESEPIPDPDMDGH